MNAELFIARRLFFDKTNRKYLSQRIIRIAVFSIALGVAVMLVSVAVVTGFKKEIRNKVIGFGSHIQIINFDSNNSYETQPISKNQAFLQRIEKIKEIKSVHVYATKPGMIKTDEYMQGVVFKGVDSKYDWHFFQTNLQEGRVPAINDSVRATDILISKKTAQLLQIKLNDKITLYFVNENESTPRILQLIVCGIYNTSLEEFDRIFIMGDILQIQRLNNWEQNEISGFELALTDFSSIDKVEQQVRNLVIDYSQENTDILRTESITRQYPQIFDWLSILDMNVWIILILMVLVAGFNMISGLLVLILERSSMIGILKSMGSSNWSIRKVFIYLSSFLTAKGLFWGNIIGIAVLAIQKYFRLIQLNPETYFMNFVPVNFSLLHLLALNIGSILITTAMLIIPSYLISRISPDKSIRFD